MVSNNMQSIVISDASPLIFFAKLDALKLLSNVFDEITVPPAVITESVYAGKQRYKPDAERIRKALAKGVIVPLKLTEQEAYQAQILHQNTSLGSGECEVIICASQRGAKALLHDKRARSAATRYGVKTVSITDVLYLALLRRKITLHTFKKLLRQLAIMTGMSAATLLEHESIADEIALQLQIKE